MDIDAVIIIIINFVSRDETVQYVMLKYTYTGYIFWTIPYFFIARSILFTADLIDLSRYLPWQTLHHDR